MTTWRFPCQSPRSIVCQWSGGRRRWPSFMPASTWSWPQSSSPLSTRGSRLKKAAHLFLISFLTILTGSSGPLRWQRSMAWCCWLFGWFSYSSSDTGKHNELALIILFCVVLFAQKTSVEASIIPIQNSTCCLSKKVKKWLNVLRLDVVTYLCSLQLLPEKKKRGNREDQSCTGLVFLV